MCIVLLSFSLQPSVGKEKNYYLSMAAGFLSAIMLLFVITTSGQKVDDKKTLSMFGTVYLTISGLCGYASTVEYLSLIHI